MGDEALTLHTTGGRLWRAVRQPITDCLNELHGGPHECRLGGGTTLAARWGHRDSFDIDLTVSRGANLSSLRADFEPTMARLGGRAEYLVGRWKIDFGTGQVDLAQLEPCPARGQRTAVVDGEPFTVLSTAQILHGKLERATRSPVRDVFDAIKARRLDPHALAIAINCRSRLDAETICVAWAKSNATFEKVADEQLAGVPEAMRENPASLGRQGAAALQDALYRRVSVRTEAQLTVVETETKGGLTRRITMAPDDIDPGFALNGLDEHFYHNVMGGERIREIARQAVTGVRQSELRWETGQVAPALQASDRPHRGPDRLR